MNNTLPSSFVFLASEKISSDSLFEGFNVDLESTANLVKSLADYNPTVILGFREAYGSWKIICSRFSP